jgi:DNA-damage-inducible protein D
VYESLLLKRGIKPEELEAEEDIKKVERRLKSADKKLLKDIKKLKENDDNENDNENDSENRIYTRIY